MKEEGWGGGGGGGGGGWGIGGIEFFLFWGGIELKHWTKMS